MKTLLYRVMIPGLAVASLLFGVGCEHKLANAAVPGPVNANNDKPVAVTDVKAVPPAQVVEAAPVGSEVAEAEDKDVVDQKNPPRIVDKATLPETLKPTPALEEIIKLIQAGISEDVIMTYVTNSTNFFKVGSDEIVYLNDLGVSTTVVNALIHHDSSPEMLARKTTANVHGLPPGVALTTPARNVYPEQPVAEETNLPPTVTAPLVPQENGVVTYDQAPENVSYFYGSLAPYGSWVEADGYGLCWQPTVAVGNPAWRPYADGGRWLWSDYGWYWYSDYSWGWAPFHYGRWCTYPRLGWVWVPDTCWGPSWVSWRYNSSYCGWAPLPPGCNYVSGFGLYYQSGFVSVGFDFGLSPNCWTFIRNDRFCDRRASLHYVSHAQGARLLNDTKPHNDVRSSRDGPRNNGIGRGPIADANRGEVPTVRVRDGQVARGNARRPERLERNNSGLVVTRPQLPKEPAARPTVVAARVSSEPTRDASLNAPKASANRNVSGNGLLAARLAEQKPARPVSSGSAPAPSGVGQASSRLNNSEPVRPSPSGTTAARKRTEERSSVVRSSPQRAVSPPLILGADPVDARPKANNESVRVSPRTAPATRAPGNPSVNTAASQQSASTSTAGRQPEVITRGNGATVNSRQIVPPQSAAAARQPSQTAPSVGARPNNVPPSNPRPQNSASAASRPVERYRVYTEPPGASRSASQAPQQAARPQMSQPSVQTSQPLVRMSPPPQAPAARPSFQAPRAPVAVPRSEPMRSVAPPPAVRSTPPPAVRSEPARPAAPSQAPSGRSQAPSNAGGGRYGERGR